MIRGQTGFALTVFIGVPLLFVALWLVTGHTDAMYRQIGTSPDVAPTSQLGEGHEVEAANGRQIADPGVTAPASREDRAGKANSKNEVDCSSHNGDDCDEGQRLVEQRSDRTADRTIDLSRTANRIALETFRQNGWIGFMSAFGVLIAAVGVAVTAISLQTTRTGALKPTMAIHISQIRRGHIRVTVRNIGLGPASDILLVVDDTPARLETDRIGIGGEIAVELRTNAITLSVLCNCTDLDGNLVPLEKKFVRDGAKWLTEN
ncbi:MAG: hypothetical protein C0510_00230 [Erythrobacter sp.]|nr:hypothetical protein [Erythrobacter sp.]